MPDQPTTTTGPLAGPIKRLERIRDIDEQTSDGSLGSLARHALDELAALSEQDHPAPSLGREDAERLDRIRMMLEEFDAAADTWQDRDDLPEHCRRLANRARQIHGEFTHLAKRLGDRGTDHLVAVLYGINHSDAILDAAHRRFEQVAKTESTRHAVSHALDTAVFVARTGRFEGAPSAWEWAKHVFDEHGMEAAEIGTKEQIERLTEECPVCEADDSGGGYDEPPSAMSTCTRCVGGRVPAKQNLGDGGQEEELALRLADVMAVIQSLGPRDEHGDVDEDWVQKIESDEFLGSGFFSVMDHALYGTPGCLDAEEQEARRRAALDKYADCLGFNRTQPVPSHLSEGGPTRIGGQLAAEVPVRIRREIEEKRAAAIEDAVPLNGLLHALERIEQESADIGTSDPTAVLSVVHDIARASLSASSDTGGAGDIPAPNWFPPSWKGEKP
jgi:hypothetical protein